MKILLHAPTAGALGRARSNLRNLLRDHPAAEVRIVANADAVAAALAGPDPATDAHLSLCENTLRSRGLEQGGGIATVPNAMHALVTLQQQGWIYIRA